MPEYWSGQLFHSPGDLPSPGIKPRSPALQADSLPAEPQGKPAYVCITSLSIIFWWTLRLRLLPYLRQCHYCRYEHGIVSSRYISRSRIAASHCSSVFNFLRIFHVFHIVAVPVYYPYSSPIWFLFLHVHIINFFLLCIFMVAILIDLKSYLIVVLICISIITSDLNFFSWTCWHFIHIL